MSFDNHPLSNQFENPLNRIKKLSGWEQEHIQNQAQAMIKAMGVKEDEVSDMERKLKEAGTRIKNVRQYIKLIADAEQEQGKDINRKLLSEEACNRFRANFEHYNKDDLLFFLVSHFADMAVREVV